MPKKRCHSLTFEFRENCLHINRNKRPAYKITVWPKPNARAVNAVGDWQRLYPEFRLIDYPLRKPKKKKSSTQLELGMDLPPPRQELSKKAAYDALRKSMPFSYAIALAPFQSHQWNLMILLSMKRRFYDLIKSNAVLAYMLANHQHIMTQIYRKELMMDTLTGMKQPELFKLMGFPATRQFSQIVRKITPATASPATRQTLLHCLHDQQTIKRLSHLKKINTGVLTLLTRSKELRERLTPQLLEEVSSVRSEDHYPATAHQFAESFRWHREINGQRPFPVIRTREELSTYHDDIVLEGQQLMEAEEQHRQMEEADHLRTRQARLKEIRRKLDQRFNDPPVPGTDAIIPLRTPRELHNEGREQHNCVGGYSKRVEEGNCYIYKILFPERATLSITRYSNGGRWSIGELRTACNNRVSSETRALVREWLYPACVGI